MTPEHTPSRAPATAASAVLSPDEYGALLAIDLTSYDAQRPRSKQADAGILGVSDIYTCREKVRRLILGMNATDVTDSTAALIGTYIHEGIAAARKALRPDLLHEVELTVKLPNGVTLLGHADEIDPSEPSVTDYKGLSLDTPIPTPTGWTTMGALRVGDEVFGSDGNPCMVTAKSDVKAIGTYIVTFGDGSKIVCDEEHYWWVMDGFPPITGEPVVRQIQEIKARLIRRATPQGSRPVTTFRVPNTAPLRLPDAVLPIDPWALGAWLGDGSSAESAVTIGGDDLDAMTALWAAAGEPIRRTYAMVNGSGTYAVGPTVEAQRDTKGQMAANSSLRSRLAALGVLGHKHVPDSYLRASIAQRTALVQGLMDTDGSWNGRRRRAVYVTTSKLLAEGMHELLVSLGEKPIVDWREVSGFGVTTERCAIEWTPTNFNPFRLPRKADRVRVSGLQRTRGSARTIIAVEVGPDVPTACIAVDSPNRTYLCGRQMVPTHNTKAGLDLIRRAGSDEQQRAQRHLYYLGALQAGIITSDKGVVRNVFIDRSGKDAHPHVEQEPFSMDVVYAAQEWLADSLYAAEHGEDASKDRPRPFCQKWCQFYTSCRGHDGDNEDYLTGNRADILAEMVAAKVRKDEAAAVYEQAREELVGVTGNSDTHWVRSTMVNAKTPYIKVEVGSHEDAA